MTKPLLLGLVAAPLLLTGCLFDPPADKGPEAEALSQEVAGLPGVDDVELRYDEGVALDPADVNLTVRMADDATAEEVADVFATGYAGLLAEHDEEEGNLVLRWGDDKLELRSFEPRAEAADVREAAVVAAGLVDRGRLYAQVTTQDVAEAPHVRTSLWLTLPEGSTPRQVAAERQGLRDAHDGFLLGTVRVKAAGQGPGFPPS